MRYSVMFIALALALSSPALAQGTKTIKGDGLSYTTQGAGKGATMRSRTLYRDEKSGDKADPYRPLQKGPAPKPPTDAELEAAKTWQRYKALARGESKQKNDEEVPDETAKAAQAPSQTGMAGLIDQYGKNKAQRSQMKTIRVTQPEEAEKTETKKNAEPEQNQ